MTYNSDAAGNYYVGEINQEVGFDYPLANLIYNNYADIQVDLNTIFSLLNYQSVSFAGSWSNGDTGSAYFNWSNADETIRINERFRMFAGFRGQAIFYRDLSFSVGGDVSYNTNPLPGTSRIAYTINEKGILIIFYRADSLTTPSINCYYAGRLNNVNPSKDFVTKHYENSCFVLTLLSSSSAFVAGEYMVKQLNQYSQSFLQTGAALHPITCSDTQTPGSNLWCTDLYVFNSVNIGWMGKVPNVIVGVGTGWQIGKAYKLLTPSDNGHNNWICVQDWGNGRYFLARSWSSDE